MTNHHDDYGVMIQLLVDCELAGLERESLIAHIIDCPNCQKELKEAQVFSARVRSARPQVEAPEGLREKILSNVNNSSSQSIRAYWRPLAAAAMFVIALGVVLSLSYLRRESRAKSFIETAIAEHRVSGNGGSLDVESSSPEVIAAWFAQRVSFPFRMANDGIAANDRAKYTLVGGRLVTFGGQPAALVEFRTQSNRVSMLVSSNKLATATVGKVTLSAGLKLHATNMGGLHVATWVNKGLTYALISPITMGTNSSCSSCHRDAPTVPTTAKSSHDPFLHMRPQREMTISQSNQFRF